MPMPPGFCTRTRRAIDLKTAGKLGGAMAAQVISQYGPRAEKAEILKLKASVASVASRVSSKTRPTRHRSNDSRRDDSVKRIA